nr:MAG TPA: hypothetical protein [Caudoviricetes sp.]DAR75262.1 MAG TPA: hypothetical protein [Caudoviricetes sp.]DAT43557.1 MAG TPA: hypothetical protein [Caudoviricetes sp.]DAY26713.1 MAG TPA: hypothetical protein [Caudoviricetes sp.]
MSVIIDIRKIVYYNRKKLESSIYSLKFDNQTQKQTQNMI